MEDLRHHFYATVGQLLEQAELGGLRVRLELADGASAMGVPEVLRQGGPELDDTGYPLQVLLSDIPVPLAAVQRATIEHPDFGVG